MNKRNDFTQGKILGPLLSFAMPVLFALFLQAMYGAVDLLVVGKFGTSADVSAVSTGSQIMMTITHLLSGLSMGTTIFLGQKLGEGKAEQGGKIIGASIWLFAVIGLVFTVLVPLGAGVLADTMNAPAEAFDLTVDYIRICGFGIIVIIAYNLIGSIFRGMGDSKTPLITVLIACICNIIGDLLLVAVFKMGTAGAAIATVFAQFVSVVISVALIRKQKLPFTFKQKYIRPERDVCKKVVVLGLPIALQDLLVGMSFLIILAIVNDLGLVASAGVGVAEKVCAFIMLVPSAYMQSMSAFVAQNIGAGKEKRARETLWCGILSSAAVGVVMFWAAFFDGDALSVVFVEDPAVVAASAEYLKSYAIDCLLTSFLFCFFGIF